MPDLGTAFGVTLALSLAGSLFCFTPLWGARLLFRKLGDERPTESVRSFSVSDGLVLIVLVALSNAASSLLREDMRQTPLILLVVSANVLAVCIWLIGLQIMLDSGITRNGLRVFFQLVVHPMAIVGPSGVIINVVVNLLSAHEMFDHGFRPGIKVYLSHPMTVAAACTLVVSLATCWLARRLFAWIVRRNALPAAA